MKHLFSSVLIIFSLFLVTAKPFPVFAHQGDEQKEENKTVAPNMGVWFEIPVTDVNRAVAFYNSVFAIKMDVDNTKGFPMAFFPGAMTGYGSGGALIQMDTMKPGPDGTTVYLNAGEDLSGPLSRVESSGGKVLVSKTQIPGVGYFALFLDTEGNKLGLFSAN